MYYFTLTPQLTKVGPQHILRLAYAVCTFAIIGLGLNFTLQAILRGTFKRQEKTSFCQEMLTELAFVLF